MTGLPPPDERAALLAALRALNGHGPEVVPVTGTVPTAGHRVISASDLVTKVFPEPRWAVPGLIPEGATLLVGAPKRGKSWLLLGLGIAVAAGGRAIGKLPVQGGDVLLLCLEDSQRRLQERLWRTLDGEAAPSRLYLGTAWPLLSQGGDQQLAAWLTEHPDTRLVGIDVLARLRPPTRDKGDLYQKDYDTMAAFKQVADAYGVALVVVHHSRKADADDPLDTISGTAGLAAAADTALILKREKGKAEASLYVRGRDVAEADYTLGFDPVTCRWSLLGDADVAGLSVGRAEIVSALAGRGPMTPKMVADVLGVDAAARANIRQTMLRMANAEQLVVRDGWYDVPDATRLLGGAS